MRGTDYWLKVIARSPKYRAQARRRLLRSVEFGRRCWLFKGHRSPKGYGIIKFKYQHLRANRVAWAIEYGDVPEGMYVVRRKSVCKNANCIRPDHMCLDTHASNRSKDEWTWERLQRQGGPEVLGQGQDRRSE